MKPKKQLIDIAIADGSTARMDQLLSASHILLCEANNLVEEASDLMQERGLMIGLLKKRHNDLVKCADLYFKEFAVLVETEENKMAMFGDMDDFREYFRKWAKISADWKPKKIES